MMCWSGGSQGYQMECDLSGLELELKAELGLLCSDLWALFERYL